MACNLAQRAIAIERFAFGDLRDRLRLRRTERLGHEQIERIAIAAGELYYYVTGVDPTARGSEIRNMEP